MFQRMPHVFHPLALADAVISTAAVGASGFASARTAKKNVAESAAIAIVLMGLCAALAATGEANR